MPTGNVPGVSPELPPWSRPRFEPGGAHAVLLYALYGSFPTEALAVARDEYRTAGLPAGLDVRRIPRGDAASLPFLGGDLGRVIAQGQPELFAAAAAAPECLLLKGEFADPATLNYLRDTIGMIAWFFDHGAIAATDPQRLRLYDPIAWWEELFAPLPPKLANHTVILSSPEPGGTRWLHTRGLRKFGRPDVSIRQVTPEQQPAVIEMINRLILLQAEGGRVPEGQPIRLAGLPPGLTCHHAGSLDDPEFNNTHLEIRRTGAFSF